MAKKTLFICQDCGFESLRWLGKCPQCDIWNSFVEISARGGSRNKAKRVSTETVPVLLRDVKLSDSIRMKTRIAEVDRSLGGGFVQGQVLLLAGEPGIGKSTLLLQIADSIEGEGILYISGEESLEQIKLRSDRLGIKSDKITLFAETDLETILEQISSMKPSLVIIDSIQTLNNYEINSSSGSVIQVKACSLKLTELAKKIKFVLVLVGHITKGGAIAGPKVLEHSVDTVLYLEGDKIHTFRLLRVYKNRFGPTSSVGVFEMVGNGLKEVKNPSDVFLKERLDNLPGSVVTVISEGNRPFLVEIQTLVTSTSFSFPKRTASGFDFNRLLLITAVLSSRLKFNLLAFDIYVNVAGGIKLDDVGADLGVALAIISMVKNKVLKGVAVFGEVGLSGEIRNVPQMEQRVKEARRLGYKRVIGPHNVKTVKEAMEAAL